MDAMETLARLRMLAMSHGGAFHGDRVATDKTAGMVALQGVTFNVDMRHDGHGRGWWTRKGPGEWAPGFVEMATELHEGPGDYLAAVAALGLSMVAGGEAIEGA